MTDQPQPDWGAMLDQMQKGMADLASLVASYYLSLVAHGVPPDHAAALASNLQATTMMLGAQQQGGGA